VEDDDLLRGREERGIQCTVWYGTNRVAIDRSDEGRGYTDKRDSEVHYGKCLVSIPKAHHVGQDKPSLWRRLLHGDTEKVVLNRIAATADKFWAELQEAVHGLPEQGSGEQGAGDTETHALVYVHGFNVDFQKAAIRAAQIGADLKVDVTAFFSWPSAGDPEKYGYDADSVQFSEEALAEFLQRLSEYCRADRLHLRAHSMGNRCVLRSLKSLLAGQPRKRFGQIFLAAPDVDQMVFHQQGMVCPPLCSRTTLYVSRRDRALEGSGLLHSMTRAGLAPPVTILKDIDTVDVTEIDLSFVGHGYFAAARPVLYDLHELMHYNTPPAKRMALLPCKTETQEQFWRIGA
jgi:esterase/lipase superfamily enzyme